MHGRIPAAAILLFSALTAFALAESSSKIPPETAAKVARAEDADAECTAEFLDALEKELSSLGAGRTVDAAAVAVRRAEFLLASADYAGAEAAAERARSLLERLAGESPTERAELLLARLHKETFANLRTVARDLDGVERHALAAAEIFARVKGGDCAEVGECLLALAIVRQQRNDNDTAEELFRESAAAFEKSDAVGAKLAQARYLLGRHLQARGKEAEGKRLVKEALKSFGRLADDGRLKAEERSAIHSTLSAHHFRLGDYKKAAFHARKSAEISGQTLSANDIRLCYAYQGVASILDTARDYDGALAWLGKAEAVAKAAGSRADLAEIYQSYSTIYTARQDPERALLYLKRSLSEGEAAHGKDSPQNVRRYLSMAEMLAKRGLHSEAISYRTKIHAMSRRHGAFFFEDGMAFIGDARFFREMSPGGTLAKQAERPETKEFLRSMYESCGKGAAAREIRSVLPNFGGADDPETLAVALYARALGRFRLDPDQITAGDRECLVWDSIGAVYLRRGEAESALQCFTKSLRTAEQSPSRHMKGRADALANIGTAKFMLGRRDEAAESWLAALDAGYADDANPAFGFSEVRTILTPLLKKDSIKDKKLREKLTARVVPLVMGMVERYRRDMGLGKEEIMRLATPAYYLGVQHHAEGGDAAAAFACSEAMRNRGFLDQLGAETALRLDGVTEEERTLVRSLAGRISRARAEIEDAAESADSAADELKAAEKLLSETEAAISARIPKYGRLRNPATASAEDAMKFCGKDRAILEYVIWDPAHHGDNRAGANLGSYCIVVTDSSVRAVRLDGGFDYAGTIASLRDGSPRRRAAGKLGIAAMAAEETFEEERNALHEKLVAPILPLVKGKKRLLVVPDGTLALLPFDILRKDAGSPMLCDSFALSLSPSVSISMLAEPSRAKGGVLALGGAWYDDALTAAEHASVAATGLLPNGQPYRRIGDWGDLPGTTRELERLRKRAFGKSKVTELTQADATEGRLKELSRSGKLAKFSVVQFACHGAFGRADEGIPTSLLLSEVARLSDSKEDGFLTLPEAALLTLDAEIAGLSACETGVTETRLGDGMVGFARSLMVAGANRVGVSLWEADDGAAVEFMAEMHRKAARQKISYAEAYRRTKEEFRKGGKWSHPFYWAVFTLYE